MSAHFFMGPQAVADTARKASIVLIVVLYECLHILAIDAAYVSGVDDGKLTVACPEVSQ